MPNLRARLRLSGQSPTRTLGWAAVIGLLAVAMLAPASPALSNDTPGNNGTVKIHEGNTENDPGEVRNEPHVCTFHLHFYFSDPEQAGTWEIQEWSPGDKGTVVLSGTYDTQGDGEDRQPPQGVYTLDPGHYKLFWDGDLDTLKHDKMKVFWVDCETETTTTTTTETPTTTTSETSSVSETTTDSETSSTTESSSTTETSSVSETTTSETSSVSETTTTTESPTTTSETSSVSETTTTTESPTTTSETSSVSETTTTTETPTTTTSFSQTVSGTTTSGTTTSFSQTVSGTTTTAGPTQPNTATADEAPPVTGGSAGSLLIAAFAFLLGSALVLVPSRRRTRE